MSMLTAQVENLRIMARLVRDYDHREVSRELREAADTIENLRNRLTETCRLKKGATAWLADYNGYITEWTCDECGGLTFYDAELRPRFCADCGRRIVG